MWGAIAGDVIGSVHEGRGTKTTEFPLLADRATFTDDTVLTVATAEVLMAGGDFREAYQRYFHRYPHAGFGGLFAQWAMAGADSPYGSFGNGSAMRIAPVGWALDGLDEVLAWAQRSAAVSHDHPEGIKGAQAVAAAVWRARQGGKRDDVAALVTARFGYDLQRPIEDIRPGYRFDPTCQGSVPEALRAFLEAEDFEHAVRLAISLGGDADTLAAMTGAVAEAWFGGVPGRILRAVRARLDDALVETTDRFCERFGVPVNAAG